MEKERLISISELSKMTGLSTRMLRYYDEKDILKPVDYSEAGQRLYDDSALMVLQVISAFSYLGYSADQIRDMMKADHNSMSVVLREQKKMLEDEREKLDEMIDVLTGVIDKTDRKEKVSLNETARIIKLTKNKIRLKPKKRLKERKNAGVRLYTIEERDSFHNWLTWIYNNMDIPKNAVIAEFDAGQANVWRDSVEKMSGMKVDSWYEEDIEPNTDGFDHSEIDIDWKIYETISDIPNETYDVIFDSYVEYHDMPVEEWLEKVWDKLKTGGKFYSVCIDDKHKSQIAKWCSILNSSYEESREARIELYGIDKAKEYIGNMTEKIKITPKIDKVVIYDKEELIDQIVALSGYTARNESARKQYAKLCRVIDEEFRRNGKVEFEARHYLIEGVK